VQFLHAVQGVEPVQARPEVAGCVDVRVIAAIKRRKAFMIIPFLSG